MRRENARNAFLIAPISPPKDTTLDTSHLQSPSKASSKSQSRKSTPGSYSRSRNDASSPNSFYVLKRDPIPPPCFHRPSVDDTMNSADERIASTDQMISRDDKKHRKQSDAKLASCKQSSTWRVSPAASLFLCRPHPAVLDEAESRFDSTTPTTKHQHPSNTIPNPANLPNSHLALIHPIPLPCPIHSPRLPPAATSSPKPPPSRAPPPTGTTTSTP